MNLKLICLSFVFLTVSQDIKSDASPLPSWRLRIIPNYPLNLLRRTPRLPPNKINMPNPMKFLSKHPSSVIIKRERTTKSTPMALSPPVPMKSQMMACLRAMACDRKFQKLMKITEAKEKLMEKLIQKYLEKLGLASAEESNENESESKENVRQFSEFSSRTGTVNKCREKRTIAINFVQHIHPSSLNPTSGSANEVSSTCPLNRQEMNGMVLESLTPLITSLAGTGSETLGMLATSGFGALSSAFQGEGQGGSKRKPGQGTEKDKDGAAIVSPLSMNLQGQKLYANIKLPITLTTEVESANPDYSTNNLPSIKKPKRIEHNEFPAEQNENDVGWGVSGFFKRVGRLGLWKEKIGPGRGRGEGKSKRRKGNFRNKYNGVDNSVSESEESDDGIEIESENASGQLTPPQNEDNSTYFKRVKKLSDWAKNKIKKVSWFSLKFI